MWTVKVSVTNIHHWLLLTIHTIHSSVCSSVLSVTCWQLFYVDLWSLRAGSITCCLTTLEIKCCSKEDHHREGEVDGGDVILLKYMDNSAYGGAFIVLHSLMKRSSGSVSFVILTNYNSDTTWAWVTSVTRLTWLSHTSISMLQLSDTLPKSSWWNKNYCSTLEKWIIVTIIVWVMGHAELRKGTNRTKHPVPNSLC